MVKILRFALLTLSATLLLLHNTLPHQHSSTNDKGTFLYEQSDNHFCYLGALRLIFQNDLGENGHLEKIVVSKTSNFGKQTLDASSLPIIDFGYSPFAWNEVILPDASLSAAQHFETHLPFQLAHLSSMGLRAPPRNC